jgi:cytochrome c553
MAKQEYGRKVRLTVTIAPDLHAKIQELGKGRRGGVSGVVEDCVRCHLDELSKTPDPLVPEIATTPEEVQQIMKELLSPELVWEAMKIVRQKSEAGEEIVKSRSKQEGKAVG